MAKGLDFWIDDLTNSIRNRISGDTFQTEVSRLTKKDLKNTTKKTGWNFDWSTELANNTREVFKLTIVNNPMVIQGLISVTIENDHVYINLLESAAFNIGEDKLYEGVPGNLVAYACKLSFRHGHMGFVAFTAKTKLIKHYETTSGALHFGGHKMILPTDASSKLVEKYFKT